MSFLLLLLFMLFPSLVLAQTDTSTLDFTPPPTDYSVVFLGNLFGVVDGVLSGSGSQIMGAMFGVFNAAVLALGGIVVMYTIIVGTMNTAHEGQMLGQKWSSIWVTMRSTVGLAFLIPKTSGYCLMQIFVMWIVVQGVGAADKVWDAALQYLNRGGAIVKAQNNANSTTTSPQGPSYNEGLISLMTGAGYMLDGLVCMQGLQNLLTTQQQTLLTNAANGSGICSPQSLSAPNANTDVIYFCNNPVPNFIGTVNTLQTMMQGFVSSCDPSYQYSSASMPPYSVPMPNFTNNPTYAKLNGVCGTIVWNNFNPNLSGYTNLTCSDEDTTRQSRAIAVQQMYSDLTQVANVMVDNDPQINTSLTSSVTQDEYSSVAVEQFGLPYLSTAQTPCTSASTSCNNWGPDTSATNQTLALTGFELQNALADYNGIMLPALNLTATNPDTQNAYTNFINASEQQGWIVAGSYFFDLAYLNGFVTENSKLIDENSGLGSSTFNVSDFTQNSLLLTLFSGASTQLSQLESLINATGVTSNGAYNFNVSTTATAVTDQRSSTVNGFITNAAMVHLPGQPGLTMPTFSINLNLKPTITTGIFPKKRFTGIWAQLENGLYNTMFVGAVNIFVSFVVGLYSTVIQTMLYLPLQMLMTTLNNGVQLLQTSETHPIIALAYMGASFVNASVEVWLNLLVSGLALTPITVGFVWPAIIMILPFLSSWLGIMVGIGYIDAYYVPFVPYMIFTFGGIAWMMAVIEAMIAGPIVALGIMHPEGHEAFGKAEQAFMILVNIFLRPSMMILGYISAIALSYVAVFLLNAGFSNVMQFLMPHSSLSSGWASVGSSGAQSAASSSSPYTNWAAIYASFFCLVTYTGIYVTLVQKSFTLIYMLPDKILRWMGSQGESYGQETAQWAEDTKAQTKESGEATGKAGMKAGSGTVGKLETLSKAIGGGIIGGEATLQGEK